MEEMVIKLLFQGKTQYEISEVLKSEGKRPNSLSSIEKTLSQLKKKHNANTMFQLGVILAKKQH